MSTRACTGDVEFKGLPLRPYDGNKFSRDGIPLTVPEGFKGYQILFVRLGLHLLREPAL
jgi:hypothetical protein